MPKKFASLSPLHLACGIKEDVGPELVKLLLDASADPNAAADIGKEYLSMCESEWNSDVLSDVSSLLTYNFLTSLIKKNNYLKEIRELVVGRTPLHIACARSDPNAIKVIRLLLEYSANPNLICNVKNPHANSIEC